MPDDDARREYKRQWAAAHREEKRDHTNELARLRRQADPEKYLAKWRKYREAHREELCRRAREYREDNPERLKEIWARSHAKNRDYQQALYRKTRSEALAAYGGECACCGETAAAFLTIDHINNDGSEHRKNGTRSGIAIYRWLKREGYPSGRFQVLCYNCNCSKQHDTAGHRAAHPKAVLIDGGKQASVG